MFGERFAYQFEGGDQGWTPPWLRDEGEWQGHGHGHHEHHGPHRHHEHHHGGPEFGPRFFMHRRGPFGGHGSFGPYEGGRAFGRGDLKYALLELLQERPMHGYEMIKSLEEKSGGFYSPSPGSVYPTLQMLEDGGYVTSKETEGKKVYSITDAGRAMLAERKSEEQPFGPPWMRGGRGGRRPSPEMQALRSEAMEVMRLFAIAGRMAFQNPEQLSKLRATIERTRKDLTDMIYSSDTSKSEGTAQQAPSSGGQSSEGPTVEQA